MPAACLLAMASIGQSAAVAPSFLANRGNTSVVGVGSRGFEEKGQRSWLEPSHLPSAVPEAEVLVQPPQRPPHSRVEMVFYCIVSASRKQSSNLLPLIAIGRMCGEEGGFLVLGPWGAGDERRELVVPPGWGSCVPFADLLG